MSELTKLLEGVNVEWKEVGDVLIRTKGTKITAEQMKAMHKEGAPLKIFAGGKTTAFFDFKDIPEKDINTNPSIIVKSRGVIEFEYYDLPFSHKNEMWSYYSGNQFINLRFIYYLLKKEELYFQNIGKKMQMPQISIPITDKFKIPIPYPDNPEKSLKIQEEIVRILDRLSEETNQLTAALQKELQLHQKRYDYYREELFKFEGKEVEWKSLGKIASIYDGTHQTPKYVDNGVPFVSVQNIKNLYATNKYISPEDFEKYKYKPHKGDIFMTRIGSIGSCAIVENDDPLAYYVTLTLIRANHDIVTSKYLKHLIESDIGQRELLKRTLVNATPIKINLGEIGKIKIPIPCPENPVKSQKIQNEIVSVLDEMDAKTQAITAAIQKEIAIRNKQYKFYRDHLLSFQSLHAEAEAI